MKYLNILLKIIAIVLVVVLFLPILIAAVISDVYRLFVNFGLFIFANLCFYVADKGHVPFKEVMERTNYNL